VVWKACERGEKRRKEEKKKRRGHGGLELREI